MERRAAPGPRAPGSVRFRSFLRNTIHDVLVGRGWKESDSDAEWDFYWADTAWIRENFDHIRFEDHQRVNHFRNHFELTRKDLLIKNVKRMRRQLEKEEKLIEASRYDFVPPTFVLPSEYALFLEHFRKFGNRVYIMKPIGKAQGKGIFLFNKLNQISEWKKDYRYHPSAAPTSTQPETYIVQEYIANPLLIGGRKFDLRLYAFVTSYSPLNVYMYRAGFARFSNHRFSMNMSEISNNYIHLTNVAVQKTAPDYDDSVGCKWSMRSVKMYLISKFGSQRVNALMQDIQDVILRSLLAVQRTIINDKHCFELYGYDVLIDENLKPWLLEVNASPSLSCDTREDYELKYTMLNTMLDIVDMERRTSEAPDHLGGFDIIMKAGHPVRSDGVSIYTSLIGCFVQQQAVGHKFKGHQREPIDPDEPGVLPLDADASPLPPPS